MSETLEPDRCANFLHAIADPARLRIVDFLREQPRSVSELSDLLNLTMVSVSHHLKVMRRGNVVATERRGRFVIYRLNPDIFQPSGRKSDHLDFGCCRMEIPKR
jgi:DNA-binding transcriptional ArsR family regulator